MAETVDTTLRFLGDPANALAAINSLVSALQNAATQSANVFKPIIAQSGGAVAALNAATAATGRTAAAKGQLVTSIDKADAAMLREAQLLARIQQLMGNAAGAAKILGDAIEKSSNPQSLPALRAQLQKTYLNTNYANSPLIGAIRAINQGLGSLSPVLGSTGAGLQQLIGAGSGASSALSGVGAAGGIGAVALGTVAVAAVAVVAALAAVVTIGASVVSVLRSIGETGVQTNTQMETLRLGIATVIASVADIRNSDGIQLKGIDALNAAIPIAADQMRKLRIDSLETSATIADIAPAFQAAIGPGLVAGLTMDQIRENTIKITQAVTALGLPMDQIKQETRAILSGEINRNTQAALALGITREAALEAQKQGTFAAFLEEKLLAAGAAGKEVAKTFAAAKSNLQEAGDTFQAVVTEGLFNQIRDKANAILPQIFDKNKANLISDNFKGIADTLTRVFDTAGQTINRMIDFIFNGLKSVSSFLDQNKATVGEIIESVNQVVILVGETIAGIFQIVTGSISAGQELNVVAVAMKNIVIFVGLIGDGIKIWLSGIFTVGNAIKLAVVAPLEVAAKLLAIILQSIPFAGAAAANLARQLEASRKSATTGITESAKNFATSIANVGQASARSIAQIENARKRAGAGQRAVDGVGTFIPGATGATLRPPKRPGEDDKSAGDRARKESAEALKLLQLQEKESELSNKRIAEGLRQSLTDRLISLETFTTLSIQNDRDLLERHLAALVAEEALAVRSVKTAAEAETKRAEFSLKRATLQQESDIRIEGLRDNLRRESEAAERTHIAALAALQDAADKQAIARIRDLESQKIVGSLNAERRIIAIEAAAFDRRRAALEAEGAKNAPDDLNAAQKLADDIAKLEAERAAAIEEASRRIRTAREKEIANEKSFRDALLKGENDLTAGQIEAEKQRIDRLSALANTSGDRGGIINLRAANERAAEALRHAEAQQSLLNQENELQEKATTFEEALEVERQFNAKFEAERLRHQQALQDITLNQTTATDANDPTSNINVLGAQTATDAIRGSLQALAGDGLTVKGILTDVFKGIAQASQGALQSFILTGKGGAAAFKSLAAGIISSVAIQALVQVPFQIAEGLANQAKFLATGGANFQAAAIANFASAKFYAILGGGALALGLGIGAAGGLGGGGNNGSQSQGAGAFGGRQEKPDDTRFISGDVTGKLGQRNTLEGGIFEAAMIKIGVIVEERTRALIPVSERLTLAIERQGSAVEGLASHIDSVSEGDIFVRGAEARPDAVGGAVRETIRRDSGFTRDIAGALRLA